MRIFYWVLLIVWFIIGYFACAAYLCPQSENKDTNAVTTPASKGCDRQLIFKDKDFTYSIDDNFTFDMSEFTFNTPSSELESGLSNVTEYLIEHPDRFMKIIGLYNLKEKNSSNLKNLGFARATSVQSFFESNGIASEQLKLASKQTGSSCFSKEKILQKGVFVEFGEL